MCEISMTYCHLGNLIRLSYKFLINEQWIFSLRRKLGQTFRKTLGVYNYKIGHQQYHRQPGAVNLRTAEDLKNMGTNYGRVKLRNLRRDSERVMGQFVGRQFRFDKMRVPVYDIPDLTGFDLKPYVSYHTPRVDEDLKARIKNLNDFTRVENLSVRTATKLLEEK